MALGSVGMSSGMNINSMVSKIVESERAPKQQSIDKNRAQNTASISAYGRLRESLDTMKGLMASFRQDKAFAARKVESSDDKIVTATATTDAIAGRYAIDVLQLAQSNKIASDALPERTKFGAGTLNISLTDSTQSTPSSRQRFSIEIKDKSRLDDVIREINHAPNNPGIRASIINDTDGPRMILASERSGAKYQIKVDVDAMPGNLLNTFQYDKSDNKAETVNDGGLLNRSGMHQIQAAQDSIVVLDGVAKLASENNVIKNAIDGVDLTLTGVTQSGQTPAEIGVEYDRDAVRADIEQFVAAYNQFHQVVGNLSMADPATGESAPLAGDSIVRSAESRLKALFSSEVEGAPDNLKRLSEFGITTTRQGTLEIKGDKLDKQLTNNFQSLGDFFGGNNGFAKKVEDAIQSMTGPTGTIRSREKTLSDQNYRLTNDQVTLDRRMEGLEKRTHDKFAAMQDVTSKMQAQLAGMVNALG